jgi:hypothetical protein
MYAIYVQRALTDLKTNNKRRKQLLLDKTVDGEEILEGKDSSRALAHGTTNER